MQEYFYTLADKITEMLTGDEVVTMNFCGENTDFVRLNHNRVRQAGAVQQHNISIDLIEGARHASGECDLQGDTDVDVHRLRELLITLRRQRQFLPEDPYLYFATEVHSSEHRHQNPLPDSAEAINTSTASAKGLDLVGIWASGELYHGFANSFGQRNWHSSATFNFDWSCYHNKDKAVKANYAGFEWDKDKLNEKMLAVRQQLDVMARQATTVQPGEYRVYLAPSAVQDILDMMAWGGFGLKSHRTKQTPLIKMIAEGQTLNDSVSIEEDHARVFAPGFTRSGFVKPQKVALIENGVYRDCLVEPRSAKEFTATVNCDSEFPQSLAFNGGSLQQNAILEKMQRGIYINNLWYCNFSDRNNCQITGMTRFACFWVEDGAIQAPLNVMRFDDSVYRIFGENLIGLTQDREFIFDNNTYGQRSSNSYLLPGALVENLRFTL
ncbi:metallopeptidase TldD-related protein [Kaarinaea lacus]